MLIMRVIRSSLHLLKVVRCKSEEKCVSLERTWITSSRTVLPFASFRHSGYLGWPFVLLPSEGYLPGAILLIHGKHQNWLYSPIDKIRIIILIIRQEQRNLTSGVNGGICSLVSSVSQSTGLNQGCLRNSWNPSPLGLQPKRLLGSRSKS